MCPNASTTLKWNRILLASTRSSSWVLDGLEEAVFAEVFTGVLAATVISPCCESVGEMGSISALRAQALDLQPGEEGHQRMRTHPHDRRQVELDQRLALIGGQREAIRIG